MSGDDQNGANRNRTVFRPSPLQGLKEQQAKSAPQPGDDADWAPAQRLDEVNSEDGGRRWAPSLGGGETAEPTPPQPSDRPRSAQLPPSRLAEDDVPLPQTPPTVRNIMLAEASPLLALAAGVRSGRVRINMPTFHRRATEAIGAFDRTIRPHYPDETRQRAKYALCATIDDIAQNLPGTGAHAPEWARRSLVVSFFHENIGGDRFWQLVDDMLRYPNDNRDLIELYHACLASGFEGRFRVMPDGRRHLHDIMARLQGALDHVRSLSQLEISPEWRGENAPLRRVGFWVYVGMAVAAAAAFLFLLYVVLRIILMNTGEAPYSAVTALNPSDPLSLSRAGNPLPQSDSAQAGRLKKFLEPQIRQHLVKVVEDGQTVRVRTTVGELFKSGDDQLRAGRTDLFIQIGKAVETEQGPVTVEGHADNDRISNNLRFPDNMELSKARAETVAAIIRGELSDPSRVTSRGFGETHPIATNSTAAGKSQNRRVEVVLQRRY